MVKEDVNGPAVARLAANQAAEWLGCSVDTIYRWIHETHDGTVSVLLLLKPRPDNMRGREKLADREPTGAAIFARL